MANSALRSRNFVLLVLGQVTSLLGNLSLRFALSMYILEATGSATLFSGLLALSMVPTILLSPFGGMLADRADRRKVMVALDALSGLLVLLAGLALPLGSGIPAIAVLLFALSILAAFESPTVQACVPQMLAGEALLRGNAIVSQVQAVASLVTPFLGASFTRRSACGRCLRRRFCAFSSRRCWSASCASPRRRQRKGRAACARSSGRICRRASASSCARSRTFCASCFWRRWRASL